MMRWSDECVVVDVRALQSPMSAERGIGRYTLDCCTTLERRHPDLVTWYVHDPDLPFHTNLSLLEPTGKLRPQGHPELLSRPVDLLHVASPWETVSIDALLPEWVVPGRTAVVATVFDLIPMVFPEVYLTDVRVRVGFTVRADAMDVMDAIVTISDASAADVRRLLEVPAARVHVIHGGTAARFTPAAEPVADLRRQITDMLPPVGDRAYLLAPVGIEPRKNVDRLVQAYAQLDAGLRDRHPLVVQCAARAQDVERYAAMAHELGCAGQIHFTGYVTDAELATWYQAAELVVFPSIYEGLGLPVLEARRCGAPVICGDNSSLREVQPDPRARFDALDVAAIHRSLHSALTDPALRAELAAAPVDRRYHWDSVADTLAGVYRRTLDAAPRSSRRRRPRRPRLAVSSPVPPDVAGPAVYLGRLLEHLPDFCDVSLLTTVEPAEVQVDPRVLIEPLGGLDVIEHVHGRFDEVLYLLGNSEHHIAAEYAHRRRPGSVLLHDARLVGLYREMARRSPQLLADPAGLTQSLHAMYPGRYAGSVPAEGELSQDDVIRLEILMAAQVARSARRLFVHSEHAADMIEHDCGRRPEVLFGLPFPDPEVIAATAGTDLGLPVSPGVAGHLVASFGVLSPVKGSGLLIESLAAMPTTTRLALVGDVDDAYARQLSDLAARCGVGDRVQITGAVGDREYREWMARTDVAVQLRLVSNGESSAALNDVVAAGVPAVVSATGTLGDLPDGVVASVASDVGPAELARQVATLLDDADDRARRSALGRAHARSHTYRDAARTLVEQLFG